MHQQVHHAVGVAPLVVVPGHNLEHALLTRQVVLQCGKRVIDRGVRVVDEIGGDKVLVSEAEESLHVARGCILEQLV